MDRKKLYMGILLGVFALSACVAKRIDLVQAQTVAIEKVNSDDAYIEIVNAHQHQNELELEVVIRPNESVRRFIAGQVQVDIISPDNRGMPHTFKMTRPEKSQYGMDSKLQHVHFHARFPHITQNGTVIRITHLPAPETENEEHHGAPSDKTIN
jgi:hypothetical protein